jgi:hypothetical protein
MEIKMADLPKLDETQQYMLDKTGYFVDVEKEEKYFQIGIDTMVKAEATDAEMKLWQSWEASLRGNQLLVASISERLETIVSNVNLTSRQVEKVASVPDVGHYI